MKTSVIDELKNSGFRMTKARKAIIEVVSSAEKPLSALKIQKRIEKMNIMVNKTTVYRELDFLSKNYLVKEVYLNPREISYESSQLDHHHHLVCESCGDIQSVSDCLASELEAEIMKKQGFKVKKHSLEFFGTCSSCS